MARHRERRSRLVLASPAIVAGGAGAVLYFSGVLGGFGGGQSSAAQDGDGVDIDWCTQLKVVTASSYRPVLDEVQEMLGNADPDVCVHLTVESADGLDAAHRVTASGAHVWIPDDTSWVEMSNVELDHDAPGAGTVLATSPIYMVADESTMRDVRDAGATWSGLGGLVSDGTSGATLVLREPLLSGDGMMAASSLSTAVMLDSGVAASARALTVAAEDARLAEDRALPEQSGEIALVPEYAVIDAMVAGDAGPRLRSAQFLAGADRTAVLRYAWLPTRVDADDPEVQAAAQHVLALLTGNEGAVGLNAAGLRGPDMGPVTASDDVFPALEADPFDPFSAHTLNMALAAFYDGYRRADIHVVVDVSGSMAAVPDGAEATVLELVNQGIGDMVDFLPDSSEAGLSQFGTQLAPPADWEELVPHALLDDSQRTAVDAALADMAPLDTGTGLYNTMRDVFLHAQEHHREGVPTFAIVFTDGRNEDRPGSLTAEELTAELEAAHDPSRPVELSVVALGEEPEAEVLASVLGPVGGDVVPISTAEEIRGAFIYVVAGGTRAGGHSAGGEREQ